MLAVALETDFLLALALGEENALEAMETIKRLRGYPMASPSVLQELADQVNHQQDEALRNPAQIALKAVATWGVITPSLAGEQHAICDINAQKLVAQKLAPSYQTGLILAEAASLKARILLTYYPDWFKADFAVLKIFLLQADLYDCSPVPPHFFNYWLNQPPPSDNSVKQKTASEA